MRLGAPWTPEQVDALNRWQESQLVHPFTCGNRSEDGHQVRHGDTGTLVATADGWICPDCTYTQAWAHDFMLDPIPDWRARLISPYKGSRTRELDATGVLAVLAQREPRS